MKKLVALLLAMVMLLSLAACQQKPATNQNRENVTIEVYIAQVDWADAWEVMEKKFEDEHPWIDVQHVGLGEDSNFLQTRLSTDDLPDVIQINKGALWNELVAQNKLTDLTNYECAKVMPKSYADSYSYEGKLVGMCQGAAFSCMFYNMDILKKAGWEKVPTNWDELLKCCEDIQTKTGVAPLVTAAGKHTTSWMIFELILANTYGEGIGQGVYEEAFKDGSFKFADYPEVATKLDQIAPYFLEGSASAMEEDAIAYMADGLAAICLAGNWNGTQLVDAIATASGDAANAAASLPAFGTAGKSTWISVSPEDSFAVTNNSKRTAAEQEAVDIFFNWVFEAENFKLIQNARGTVPVITNMTADQIKLPDCVVPVVADMGQAPFVLMGFNLYTAEVKDAANGKIRDVLSGNAKGIDVLNILAEMVPNSYLNKG